MKSEINVENVYHISGIGTVVIARIISGDLRIGMETELDGKIYKIKAIEKDHRELEVAIPGEDVGIEIEPKGYNAFKIRKNSAVVFHLNKEPKINKDKKIATPKDIRPKIPKGNVPASIKNKKNSLKRDIIKLALLIMVMSIIYLLIKKFTGGSAPVETAALDAAAP